MSDGTKPLIPPGLYAFPYALTTPTPSGTRFATYPGMTLRDYFAGQVIQAYMARSDWGALSATSDIAGYSYEMADAMLKAREPKP